MFALSVALNVTVVMPSGKIAGALCVMVRLVSTLSVALAPFKKAVMVASVAGVPLASLAATVMFAGAVTIGTPLS